MQKNTLPRTRRAAAVLAVTTALMTLGLGAASAHVGVTPESTTEGGYTELTFTVPNESETAGTEKVEVQLPAETPFTSVRAKPVAGWSAEVITGELPEPVEVQGTTLLEAPRSVVWTADEDNAISQQQYQTFSISVGTLPEAGTTVILPTAQHYTDGSVRNWNQPAVEGAEEPENPAPSFVTTAEGASPGHDTSENAAMMENAAATEGSATDGTSRTLAWIGAAAGILGLVAGVLALLRSGRIRSSQR